MITISIVFFNSIVNATGVSSSLNKNVTIVISDGWSMLQGQWYFYKNGSIVKNMWKQDTTMKWFYLGSNGAMVKNVWRQDSSTNMFYLGDDGAMVRSTWKQDLTMKWFYLGSTGAMVKNKWVQDSTSHYFYLGTDGVMLVGKRWITIDKIQYYIYDDGSRAVNTLIDGLTVGTNGAVIKNAWKQDSSAKWFYLGADGAMVKNTWKQDSSTKWFYLGSTGEMLVGKQWITIEKIQYYIYADGSMAVNTIIDGWIVGSNGAWDGKPQILKSIMSIEVPVINAVVSDSVDIKGWALNNYGIASVTISVDGKYIYNATKGLVRNDIYKVYSNYSDGLNCGYSYTLDASKLIMGSHSITVKATGNDRTVNQASVKFLKGNNGKTQISNKLAVFTADYEGYSSTPYRGVDAQNRTIGYGHVITSGETYTYLSPDSALVLLKKDLQVHVASVNVFTTGVNISQQQFDALVDFAYNCGDDALMQSTLLRDIKSGASMNVIKGQFLLWVHCNGIAYTGLYRRRMDEWNMFAYADYTRSYISAPAGYK